MILKSISLKLVVKNPWSNLNLYFSLAFFKMIYLLNYEFYDKSTIHKKFTFVAMPKMKQQKTHFMASWKLSSKKCDG